MRPLGGCLLLLLMVLASSGCVTSHYENDQGCDCTRRYFTPLGIPLKTCSETSCGEGIRPDKVGVEMSVPSAPAPSLRQSTPAKTMEQSIKTTTQALR